MRALVVGAGISGLAAAGALARDGWQTTVLEQAAKPRAAGYMIDFFGPGYAAAAKLGALEYLRDYGELYAQARYIDPAGRTRARLSMESFLNAADGEFFSILRPDIETGLRQWVGNSANIIQGAKVISVEPGSFPESSAPGSPARVICQDGSVFEAELLIGADGIHSTIRRELLSDDAHRAVEGTNVIKHLGFHVFGYIFSDARLAARLGRDVVLTDSLERQVGLYALADGRVAFFGVAQCTDPNPSRETREELFSSFAGLGGDVDAALAQRTADMFEDIVAQSVVPKWSRGRCIILGDAAYAVSLLAGQGASLAIAGAEQFTRTLRENNNNLPAAFAKFEADWRPAAEAQQAAGRRNARFFVPPNRASQITRRLALHLMNFGPLNTFMARRAFGAVLPSKGHQGD